MRIVSILNQKGGCGKTTTAINLAGIFARRGFRTLLVDLDPQSHCAAGLAIPEQRIDQDIGDAMLAEPVSSLNPQRLLWRVSRNLDLAPSRMRLAGLEAPRGGLADRPDKERRLAAVLEALSPGYDLCLVDCSPSIGLLTYNALAAASDVLIPVETSFFALQGASKQVNTIKTLTRRLGASPRYWLVGTLHDEGSILSRDLLAELQRRFEARVAPVVIRRDVALKEAASFGLPVIEYNPISPGAEDYQQLATWLCAQSGIVPGTDPAIVPDPVGEPLPAASLDDDGLDPAAGPRTATVAGSIAPPSDTATLHASRVEELAAMARAMMGQAAGLAPTPEPKPERTFQPLVLADDPLPPVVTTEVARELLGVRQTRLGTLFVQPLTLGKRLSVAGDFNNWSATANPMRRNEEQGVWELCVPLPPGKRHYRLVVDGRWIVDPYNTATEPNPYHELNSVVEVPAGAATA